jgi:hypothetical protein
MKLHLAVILRAVLSRSAHAQGFAQAGHRAIAFGEVLRAMGMPDSKGETTTCSVAICSCRLAR